MKKVLLVLALSVALVLAFAATAHAAIWNFEKDFGGTILVVTDVAAGGGTYGPDAVAVAATTYTGQAMDNRGRLGRVFSAQFGSPQVYQVGAAGSGNMYDRKVASGVQGLIGDAGWMAKYGPGGTSALSESQLASIPDEAWGMPWYKMNTVSGTAAGSQDTTGTGTYVYLAWWAVDPDDPDSVVDVTANAVGSPHGDYVLGSVKCAVCHSVHTAAPSGAPVATEGSAADTLLRTKAEDACGYCHVAAPNTVISPVYGGVYPIPSEAGHALGGPCMECHTGPHAALAETEVASLKGKLLTLATDYGATEGVWEGDPGPLPWSTVLTRVAAIEASATAQGFTGADGPEITGFSVADYRTLVNEDIKNQAVGVFCGGCHEGSYANTVAGASASNAAGWAAGRFTGHRTLASDTGTWNSEEATKSTSEHRSIKIADDPAMSCYSCHDADNGFNEGVFAFPHNWGVVPGQTLVYDEADNVFTNQTFAWLLRASNSSRSDLTTAGGPGGKLGHAGPTGGTLSDGVCLKCHRWGVESGAATMGVGLSF